MISVLRSWVFWSVLTIFFVGILAGGILYWAFCTREHHRWNEDLKLCGGGILHVKHHMSNLAYHGFLGHFSPFWWGGGDERYEMQFTVGEKQYHWDSIHAPIAIQRDEDGAFYVVAIDCESEESKHICGYMFCFYRSRNNGSWEEIAPKDFPRHLAIQNRQCTEDNDGSKGNILRVLKIVEKMDPADPEFQCSLNGELWVFLEGPKNRDGNDSTSDESFFRDFKNKWIRSLGSSDKRCLLVLSANEREGTRIRVF